MVWSLFGRRDTNAATSNTPVIPALVEAPFHEQMLGWLDELAWYERESSGIVSAKAFAKLRAINDVLTEIAGFIKNYSVRAEDEFILKSTITDYIPSALHIFNQLPAAERVTGGEADTMLLSQCENIERSVRKLNKEMHERVMSNLATQTIFVENRFSNQP